MLTVRRLLGALLAAGVLASAACGVAGTPSPSADGTSLTTPTTSASPETRTTTVNQGDSAFKTITLTWSTGSVPPPYNYTLTLTVAGENAKLAWESNYSASDRTWSREFKLNATQAANLNSSISRVLTSGWKDSDDIAVGGPSVSYSVEAPDGSIRKDSSAIADEVDGIESLINATVPKSVYSEMEGEYLRWQKTQK
jgi:ABC-type glycerol-3-phosphate transport system substrate-binding protein